MFFVCFEYLHDRYELSEELNRTAMARAESAGVGGQVTLLQEDFMTADVLAALEDLGRRRPDHTWSCNGAAMVIAMYLLQDALYRLQPSIQRCSMRMSGAVFSALI